MHKFQLISIVLSSKDTETRTITPYDDYDTALRKFHEALTGIGGGSKRIAVMLVDSNLNVIKKELWFIPEP